MQDVEVLIAGGGPTGLTLAICLGMLGVTCELVDARPAPVRVPRTERCDARTMEIFRRLGIAGRVRAAGLPDDVPAHVFICAGSLTGPPLVHYRCPPARELLAAGLAVNDASLPLEPPQIISQYTLEPLLRETAESVPGVTIRFGTELVDFAAAPGGVTAMVRSGGGRTGARLRTVRASYLAGCDGADSTVRSVLGIEMRGEIRQRVRQALFYSPDLFERIPAGRGHQYHIADQHQSVLTVQDDTQHFSLNVAGDAPLPAVFESVAGMPAAYKTLYEGEWTPRLMLADSYGGGRVFLAGDAAHLAGPAGNLGMNTGIGDAADLAWKMAGTLRGWGGRGLLACYETERRPVAARAVEASRRALDGELRWRAEWRQDILDNTVAGARTRVRLTQVADVSQRWSGDLAGVELGYRYDGSPLIAPATGAGPPATGSAYTPTTWPGARLPHTWLEDGSALQDHLGHGYTLLQIMGAGAGASRDAVDDYAGALAGAFGRLGAPLSTLAVNSAAAQAVYAGHRLILVRPDLHVAWRSGDSMPDPDALASLVTGVAPWAAPPG
ncbi:MAG: FAD-dependent monooxygenase [Streptosporangiaceae bacterium]|nr:FAD-dependent monooxygenase [Streptosporangiaceae bacterium]MBV9858442.1 FAD-dependent monooxygenase [Streptosporangiaceae bacterium]